MLQISDVIRRENLVRQFGSKDLDSWLWLETSMVLPRPGDRNTKGTSGSCSGSCSLSSFIQLQ